MSEKLATQTFRTNQICPINLDVPPASQQTLIHSRSWTLSSNFIVTAHALY